VADFKDSHLGKLRAIVGSQLLLVPGTRIIIEDAAGKILLQKRSDFGVWGLPGGNAEPNEDLTEGITREVFEETGLTIKDAKPFGFGCNPDIETVQFPNGDHCHFFTLNFYTKTYSGSLAMLDGESLALDWFSKSALPELMPNMKASIEAYEKFCVTDVFQMI